MAAPYIISIDTVYQRVLALANKEQRGYITPQEFNLFANQAQQDMFEQYFYELSLAQKAAGEPGCGDLVGLINNKLHPYKGIEVMTYSGNHWKEAGTKYRYGQIFYKERALKMMDSNDIYNIQQSQWHKAGLQNDPVITNYADGWQVWDHSGEVTSGSNVTIEYITRPADVYWGYVVVNEQALYNASASINFTLHESEEGDLVIKILELAGIAIQKPDLVQTAAQEESQNASEENK